MILFKTAAEKLQAARNGLANCEQLIDVLGVQRREVLKKPEGEVEAVRAIDVKIEDETGRAAAYREKIVYLERQTASWSDGSW